ncbi:MAG: hypothetical protein IPM82_11360 [Saprospiraceae bacterium]|nr:hypothetical protein [Saprospiraceae bacterium]
MSANLFIGATQLRQFPQIRSNRRDKMPQVSEKGIIANALPLQHQTVKTSLTSLYGKTTGKQNRLSLVIFRIIIWLSEPVFVAVWCAKSKVIRRD